LQEFKLKNLKSWENKDFWNYSLEKYRISKKIRKIISKNHRGFKFRDLAKALNVSSDYIYQVMMMNIKPNKDFIERLNELLNNNV